MKWHNIEQRTPEWHALRLGKMTASHAYTIQVAGKGLDTLCKRLAYERKYSKSFENYQSDAMAVGCAEEEIIRIAYEMETGNTVLNAGFAEYSDYFGASGDGLVGTDGGVEFKRHEHKHHNEIILGADFDPEYIWQCHANLLTYDRKWWDLMSYNPNFGNRSLIIKRIFRSVEADEAILKGMAKGKELIVGYFAKY